jgi:porin
MHRTIATLICMLAATSYAAEEPQCPDCIAPAIAVEAAYTGEVWRQMSGGMGVGNRYLDNVDFTVDVDGGRAFDVEGLRLFGALLYNNGHPVAGDLSGAIQGVSNIETTEGVRVFELWAQWSSARNDRSLRFGLYDLNSEFDAIDSAGLFINPSHGIGPDFAQSGAGGPSIFPVTALALRAQKSAGPWSVQAVVLDGEPEDGEYFDRERFALSKREGALLAGELNYRSESGTRIGGGYWRYTAGFDDLSAVDSLGNPQRRHDNAGAYIILESPMLLANGSGRGLNLYFRTGEAESRLNAVGRYYGTGAVYSGLFFPRRQDQIGVAMAVAQAGKPWRRLERTMGADPSDGEYNYELTYRINVLERLALQVDLQRIANPGMNSALKPVWVVGLRLVATQAWAR